MATRTELLDTFEVDLAGENSFLFPAPAQSGRTVMPDEKSRIEQSVTSIDGQDTLEWHVCFYWDDPEANSKNAHFWVKNRDEAGETAVWHQNRDPKPGTLTPTFQQEMTTWLNSQIDEVFGSNTLRHIESTTADNAIERGTANVIMETATTDFVRQSAAVWKDISEVWQFKVITP
jgi:hypothetical protein